MKRALPFLFLLVALPARAADPGVRMNVEAGFAGTTARNGEWTPVYVDLENPGPAVSGSVVVKYLEEGGTHGSSEEPVDLATGAKKRITVYARPSRSSSQLEVVFQDKKERVLAGPEQAPIGVVDDETVLLGLVNMGAHTDPGLRPVISKTTKIVVMDPDELPDQWAALRALDVLVLREPDASLLGPSRIAAIKTWVSGGGTLVVATAEKWRAMDDPSFTELLPVKVGGVKTMDANQLPPPFYLQGGQVAVAVAAPLRGTTKMSASGSPIVSEARYGLGRVIFVAIEPGSLTNVPVEAKGALWNAVLQIPKEIPQDPNSAYYSGYGYAVSPEQLIQQELSRIPPLKPPSVLLVTALIALYVAVVGPGDYFFLKRLGKLHWTWVTYPLAIAGFSGLIYVYARLTRSSDMMIRTISVVDSPAEPPGAPAPMHVYGGVYSPRAGRYQVDVRMAGAIAGSFNANNPNLGISQSGSEYLTTGGKHPSLLLSIPIWSMAGVDLASSTEEPPPFLVALENGRVVVTNTGTRPIEYVGLLYNGKVIDGGRLEPGKDVKISRNDAGKLLSGVQQEVSSTVGTVAGAEDLPRIVRVLAYATDPPYGDITDYYAPHMKRRTGTLERPRSDQGQPMVFAVAKAPAGEIPIDVSSERLVADGIVVWRRPVSGSGWAVHKVKPVEPPEDYEENLP